MTKRTFLTFLALAVAARAEGFELEQTSLRRAVFKRHYDATWTGRAFFKLGLDGWTLTARY